MERDQTDQDLVLRLRNGDADALETALREHWNHVVNYVSSLGVDRDTAEDVAQQAFVKLWERREALNSEGSLRGLLCRIARNSCFDILRRLKASDRAAFHIAESFNGSTPHDDAVRGELMSIIESAVNALPLRRREVFVLIRYHGLSHREVAKVLDLAPQTVANHLGMALADLRISLAPYLPDYFLSSEVAREHLGSVERPA